MAIKKNTIKRYLETQKFGELFNQLGWDWPESEALYPALVGNDTYDLCPVAQKRGFIAYHCPSMPDSGTRSKIETKLSRNVREHIIIFTDSNSKEQIWQWVRRVPGQPLSRKEHKYQRSQPMLLIEKIGYLNVGMDEEEHIDLIDVFDKVRSAFDIERVTKRFYERFQKEHDAFLGFINGIPRSKKDEPGDDKWYASVMLNRLMFIYFIQKKRFLDGDTDYLRNRLTKVQALKGRDQFHSFYRYFLLALCHDVLAKKENNRQIDADLTALVGNVPYLNGGIFEPHEIEEKYSGAIEIPDDAFKKIFDFFDEFEWHLDNRPTAEPNEINPDVLGYIFEKYINQKQMGAYYTKEDITEYISKNTIIPCLFDKAQKSCKIAFEGEASVWNYLQKDPDRYIYPAVRHGITYDVHKEGELAEPVPYPEEIAVGLDTSEPDLLERRKHWNTPTPPDAGLPTEIWRETVARRQRYEEIHGKLERGEVRSINDLITLNLDIRQFAQDVIERCESPDLLNAFWVAIAGYIPQSGSNKQAVAGITVLDPTCGSGAFLFAALNILEKLYEACLERMHGFLEEWGEHPQHKNYASFFQSILLEIEKHTSPKYFIYKSIIVNNLFGVDIMKEAVEICKLRLFLKLVAQVEDGSKIEPLPDIDFNIKAGNTLVGFATEEEMKAYFDRDSNNQMLLQFDTRLDEIKQSAEDIDNLYNLFRQAQLEGDQSIGIAKTNLSNKLDQLNTQLNHYLADDYGIDPAKPKKYEAFLQSHQPFHWFIEFYGIMKPGGFDAIIGNPPFVENTKSKVRYSIRGYNTLNCGNLYAFVSERSLALVSESGYFAFIMPSASISTPRMHLLMQAFSLHFTNGWVSLWDERPSKLFDGVDQQLSIHVYCKRGLLSNINITSMRHWTSTERHYVFDLIRYCQISTSKTFADVYPKTETSTDVDLLNKLTETSHSLVGKLVSGKHTCPIYYRNAGGRYWRLVKSFPTYFRSDAGAMLSTTEKVLFVPKTIANLLVSALSSTIFYWFWRVTSNCRHLTDRELSAFPIPNTLLEGKSKLTLETLAIEYEKRLNECKNRLVTNNKRSGKVVQDTYNINRSKPIIDEIDKVLAEHYGFTEEELDYIINYDIKYRMGQDLLEATE